MNAAEQNAHISFECSTIFEAIGGLVQHCQNLLHANDHERASTFLSTIDDLLQDGRDSIAARFPCYHGGTCPGDPEY